MEKMEKMKKIEDLRNLKILRDNNGDCVGIFCCSECPLGDYHCSAGNKIGLIDCIISRLEDELTKNQENLSSYDCGVGDNCSVDINEKDKHGVKHDNDKPDMNLLLIPALTEIGKVLTFGKKKYAPYNYRGLDAARLISAALRHLVAHNSGILLDDETGERHLAHAACSLIMALQTSLEGKDGIKFSDSDEMK